MALNLGDGEVGRGCLSDFADGVACGNSLLECFTSRALKFHGVSKDYQCDSLPPV